MLCAISVAADALVPLRRLKRLGRFDDWGAQSKVGSSSSSKDHLACHHSTMNYYLHGAIPPVFYRCVQTSRSSFFSTCCFFQIVVGLIVGV